MFEVKTLSLWERVAQNHFSQILPNPPPWGLPEPFPGCQGHELERATGFFSADVGFLGGSWMVPAEPWLLQVNVPTCALRDVGALCGGHYLW